MSSALTAQILTQSSITMLVQVLAEDNSTSVNGLEVAPLSDDSFGSQREQLRVSWQGDKGTGQRDFVLYGLPEVTWSEQVNPNLPAPAPVLLVESDLPDAFTMIIEGFVASGRRRNGRPAWVLREDWVTIPTLAQSREQGETNGAFRAALSVVLEKSAAFHALHWGADPVLNDVYPWLPRFEAWQANAQAHPSGVRLAALPNTIIHGTWQAEHLRLHQGQLLAETWDRVMVGPAAWDLYWLLDSLQLGEWEPWLREYCGYLKAKVEEFEGTEEFVSAILALRKE